MELYNIILGVALLLFGRKLFWFFVGIAGFIVGVEFSSMFLADQPQWIIVLIGLCTGGLGSVLAIFAQRFAFALAGFYAGSYMALLLVQPFISSKMIIIFVIIGGLIGASASFWILDPILMVLSCIVGAGAIVNSLNLQHITGILTFVLLVAAGMFVQARLFTRLDSQPND